jgi:hypothetical protein
MEPSRRTIGTRIAGPSWAASPAASLPKLLARHAVPACSACRAFSWPRIARGRAVFGRPANCINPTAPGVASPDRQAWPGADTLPSRRRAFCFVRPQAAVPKGFIRFSSVGRHRLRSRRLAPFRLPNPAGEARGMPFARVTTGWASPGGGGRSGSISRKPVYLRRYCLKARPDSPPAGPFYFFNLGVPTEHFGCADPENIRSALSWTTSGSF